MSSKIKQNGVVGTLLNKMADRGGSMLADYRGFPPSWLFIRLAKKRGFARLERAQGHIPRRNVWVLTDKGWDAIGRKPPVDEECPL